MSSIEFYIFGLICGWFVILQIQLYQSRKKLAKFKEKNILEDLELATVDQLLSELRKRNGKCYIMLTPSADENQAGINIEIHNMSPEKSLSLMHLSTGLTLKALKEKGFSLPDLPELPDYGSQDFT